MVKLWDVGVAGETYRGDLKVGGLNADFAACVGLLFIWWTGVNSGLFGGTGGSKNCPRGRLPVLSGVAIVESPAGEDGGKFSFPSFLNLRGERNGLARLCFGKF